MKRFVKEYAHEIEKEMDDIARCTICPCNRYTYDAMDFRIVLTEWQKIVQTDIHSLLGKVEKGHMTDLDAMDYLQAQRRRYKNRVLQECQERPLRKLGPDETETKLVNALSKKI